MFPHLEALLRRLRFDETVDRLFSVGDLIDRGPKSRDVLAWLEYPWFHAVRGNHEQFALDSDDPLQLETWVNRNGGAWWQELTQAEREATKARLAKMPLAIEVETMSGIIGIVHADVLPFLTWDRFIQLLQDHDPDAVFCAIWSRNRVQGTYGQVSVNGRVESIYCGHTPTLDVVDVGNVHFIDTGAVYCQEGYADARLSVVEIHPARHKVYTINTNNPV